MATETTLKDALDYLEQERDISRDAIFAGMSCGSMTVLGKACFARNILGIGTGARSWETVPPCVIFMRAPPRLCSMMYPVVLLSRAETPVSCS